MSAYRSNELQIIQPCHDVPLHSLAVGVQPSAVDLSRFSLPVFPIAVDGDQQCAAGAVGALLYCRQQAAARHRRCPEAMSNEAYDTAQCLFVDGVTFRVGV